MMKFFSTLAFGLLLSASLHAAYRMDENGTTSSPAPRRKSSSSLNDTRKIRFPEAGSKQASVEKDVLQDLSDRYSISLQRLEYFRKLRYGYEEIVPALVVAREAQVEPGRVLKSRMEGKTWESIADSFSVDLKPLNKEVLDVLTPIRKKLPKQALVERPTTRP